MFRVPGMNTARTMHDRERIGRLRKLAAQLERFPPSVARDEWLREARHRTVALDTGPPDASPGTPTAPRRIRVTRLWRRSVSTAHSRRRRHPVETREMLAPDGGCR